MSETVLEMKNISKSFSKVKVLKDVNLSIQAGEVHALVGENGAGKSTLMKILMGIYSADEGEICIDGQPVRIHSPKEAIQHGISMIHQELNPVLDMEVAENVFMGREILKTRLLGLSLVDKEAQRRETAELFSRMGMHIPPRRLMRSLSVAQTQLVEIVKAISLSSKVIIMDEPTSALTEKEVGTLFEQIEKLRAQNVAVIYISHKLDEVFRIADRITVLRDGEWIGTGRAADLNHEMLIKMMVGREIKEVFPKQPASIGEVILEVRNLSQGRRFQEISFSLHAGEILGIAGLVGAGRSELVECIFGISRPTSGEVFVRGTRVSIHHPANAIRHKIALITEDRKSTGLNLIGSVEHNMTISWLERLARLWTIDTRKEGEISRSYINRLKIKAHSRKSLVSSLSGGNQQKVVLSKWLLTEPDIIILDEPTRGIDVGAKRDIYLLMGELVRAGKAVLMISSEIPEIMGLADRILVLAGGRLTGSIPREEFSQERIMKYASEFQGGNGA